MRLLQHTPIHSFSSHIPPTHNISSRYSGPGRSPLPNKVTELTAISPIDGRYARQSNDLRDYYSEYALMKYRVIVEIEWFKRLFQEQV